MTSRRRLLALVLPRLASERWRRRGVPEGALAVAGPPHAPALACLCPEAEAAGLRRGMRLADARAIHPGLVTRPWQPEEDARLLARLARWALRFTPLAAPQGTDALVLDITGAAHLFGGEAALLEEAPKALATLGFSARAGLADTGPAALALARFAPGTLAPPGGTAAAIGPLPPEAIGLGAEETGLLRSLGLGSVAEVLRLPRASLARRLGVRAVEALDRLTGAAPAPLSPAALERPFAAGLTLPEPIALTSDVMEGLRRLLERLTVQLETRQHGARRLRLTLQRTDREAVHLEVTLARPSRDAALIARLFAPQVEAADAGWGIDRLRLVAVAAEPLTPQQQSAARDAKREDALALLLGTLGNRIGFERIQRFLPAESHIPERAFTLAAAAFAPPGRWTAAGPPRPLTLFPPEPVQPESPADGDGTPPAAFRWRRRSFAVAEATGPERIAPEWWLDDPAWRSGPRDYWRVQTREGDRLWLFHTPDTGAWHAQGVFA